MSRLLSSHAYAKALSSSRGKGTWRAGIVCLVIGMVLLVSGFATGYFFFEVDSLVSMLLGIVLVFRTTQPDPWREIGVRGTAALYAALSDLFPTGSVTMKTVYIPGAGGSGPVASVSAVNAGVVEGDKVFRVTPPGLGVFQVIFDRLPGLKTTGLSDLLNLLPPILVDDLQLAESVVFKEDRGT